MCGGECEYFYLKIRSWVEIHRLLERRGRRVRLAPVAFVAFCAFSARFASCVRMSCVRTSCILHPAPRPQTCNSPGLATQSRRVLAWASTHRAHTTTTPQLPQVVLHGVACSSRRILARCYAATIPLPLPLARICKLPRSSVLEPPPSCFQNAKKKSRPNLS